VRERLLDQLETPAARELVADAERAVLAGELTPAQAAEQILAGLPAGPMTSSGAPMTGSGAPMTGEERP
ncbi:MAG TPA: hypothetical protein VF714_05235, partial [Jatrophihabitans sp.]